MRIAMMPIHPRGKQVQAVLDQREQNKRNKIK